MSTLTTRAAGLPVAVVGAGFAGLAAAWAAARAGRDVVLLDASAGASALYSGIVDGAVPAAEALELARLLALDVGSAPRRVATHEGNVRAAAGRDRALLDLEPLAGRRIALLDLGRDDWDAELLARAFSASPWSRRTRTEFVSMRVDALREGVERRIASYDLALRLDDSARVESLAEQMRASATDAAAWLAPPLLGVRSDVASELGRKLGRPVGETSSTSGGVAGARFELRRDRLVAECGIQALRARVAQVRAEGAALRVELGAEGFLARSVVLAVGGVAAGGIVLASEHGERLSFELSLHADVELQLDGEVCDAGSSSWGPSFARKGLGLLERVGLRADTKGRVSGALPLFAAGDVLAERPRSVLEALGSGTRAGLAASQFDG